MLYTKKGGQWKKLQTSVQQGLSIVSVTPRNHWGKLNGTWHRGTDDEFVVTLDFPSVTFVPEIKLWDMIPNSEEPLKIKVVIGKNAIVFGHSYRGRRGACIDLVGAWHVDTTFEIELHGILRGASGCSPIPRHFSTPGAPNQPSFTLASIVASMSTVGASLQNNTLYDTVTSFSSSADKLALTHANGVFFGGVLSHAVEEAPGGDCIRTNRPTALKIMEGTDYIGCLLAGGGAGAPIPSAIRVLRGQQRLVQIIGGGSYYTVRPAGVQQEMQKVWAFGGWSGAAGAGVFDGGYALSRPADAVKIVTNLIFNDPTAVGYVCNYGGFPSLNATWELELMSAAALRTGKDGLYSGAPGMGLYHNAEDAYPSSNVAGRTAASGGRINMTNFAVSPSPCTTLVSDTLQAYVSDWAMRMPAFSYTPADNVRMARAKSYFRAPKGASIRFYDREGQNGGLAGGNRQLVSTYIYAGDGGFPGRAGGAGSIGNKNMLTPANSGKAYGFTSYIPAEMFPNTLVFQNDAMTDIGGQPGRAIVGSEYVTVVGRTINPGSTDSNVCGAIIPFE